MTTLEELKQEIAKAREETLNLAKEKDEQIQKLTEQFQTVQDELNQTKNELNQARADLQTKINTAQATADDGVNKANAAQKTADDSATKIKLVEKTLPKGFVQWRVHPNGHLELFCAGEKRYIVISPSGVYSTWSTNDPHNALFVAARNK